MSQLSSWRWQRDLVVGVLAALVTALVLVPVAWAAVRRQEQRAEAALQEARAAILLAEQRAAEAEQQRSLAGRALVKGAADLAGFADNAGAEPLQVATAAVSPEVPKGGWLLIDRKATQYAVGDIVVFKDEGRNYLGRVVAVDKVAGRITVARNGEANRVIALGELLGRGILNTR